jgi:hypothetical protein
VHHTNDVAIYVTTTRADYRHAKALIASIEARSSCRRIWIVPDDDHREPTMFGYPVWRPTDPRVLRLDGYYKKLRVFWGPAERFMHCDADQLALRDLDPLLDRLATLPRPFFLANLSTRVHDDWQNGDRRRVFIHRAGDPELLRKFDATYDWERWFPFNSGEFSASRDAVDQQLLLDVYEEASARHAELTPGRPMMRSRDGMFMSDQGFLNYFINRWCPAVNVEWIENLYLWGGLEERLPPASPETSAFRGALIHWAGCNRPGPLPVPTGVPHARDWRRYHRAYCRSRGDWRGFLRDVSEQIVRVTRDFVSGVKRRLVR